MAGPWRPMKETSARVYRGGLRFRERRHFLRHRAARFALAHVGERRNGHDVGENDGPR
jgi:hypothetical protein